VSLGRTMTGLIRLALVAAVLPGEVACRSEHQTVARYGVGQPATPAAIAAWNIDVNPSGEGLPAGRGTAAEGARVFAANCAGCHGARGEGLPAAPALVGREPRQGFPFGESLKYVRTVGNYWPYATTLYDYINRAMPATTPGSLAPDEIYAVVAWILAQNEIIPDTAVIDAASLPRVRMPARGRFVPDDRHGGAEFR
jgi:mono/diheme cytochrome c family protein